jgi:SAM-dependent methyltransferase
VEPSLPVPSECNVELVGGSFNVGFELLGYLIGFAGLRPDDDVLDIGCGTGRAAYALAYYLDPSASYAGFDIVEELVAWCRDVISPRRPNFQFVRVDIRNSFYNPHGTIRPSEFTFPYPDGSFDVAFANSVFTHMLTPEVTRYLEEAARVLRPGGRCLTTWFLFDDEATRLHAAGKGQLRFQSQVGDTKVTDPRVPEAVAGFDEARVLRWVRECGFEVETSQPGWWSGRRSYTSFQDILVLRRRDG